MAETRDDILHPNHADPHPDFPNAPADWAPGSARAVAAEYDLELNDGHWGVIRALQEYYSRHDGNINVRELLDALNEKFHGKGGAKYLYKLLPGGPVAQGCRLAGLHPPAGAVDKGFGSVQ